MNKEFFLNCEDKFYESTSKQEEDLNYKGKIEGICNRIFKRKLFS